MVLVDSGAKMPKVARADGSRSHSALQPPFCERSQGSAAPVVAGRAPPTQDWSVLAEPRFKAMSMLPVAVGLAADTERLPWPPVNVIADKLLFSALLANDQVIVFDNLTRPLEGAALNTVLTEAAWEERILGESRTAIVPTNALFLASGNNLQINGDMHRRIIAARIDAGENPEVRTFKRPKLLDWVRNNRARLVVAGLTVLRAYEVAGRPDQKIPEYGSFEECSQRVRNALVWLGEADPCLTRARFKESDPEREALGGVLTALFPISDGAWKKCKDVVSEIDTGPAIADALNGAQIACNPKALGIYLSRHNGRTVDGLRLDTAKDKHAKVLTFRITQGD